MRKGAPLSYFEVIVSSQLSPYFSTDPGPLELRPGQELNAEILAVKNEEYLISLLGRRLTAQSDIPLKVGDIVRLTAGIQDGRLALRLAEAPLGTAETAASGERAAVFQPSSSPTAGSESATQALALVNEGGEPQLQAASLRLPMPAGTAPPPGTAVTITVVQQPDGGIALRLASTPPGDAAPPQTGAPAGGAPSPLPADTTTLGTGTPAPPSGPDAAPASAASGASAEAPAAGTGGLASQATAPSPNTAAGAPGAGYSAADAGAHGTLSGIVVNGPDGPAILVTEGRLPAGEVPAGATELAAAGRTAPDGGWLFSAQVIPAGSAAAPAADAGASAAAAAARPSGPPLPDMVPATRSEADSMIAAAEAREGIVLTPAARNALSAFLLSEPLQPDAASYRVALLAARLELPLTRLSLESLQTATEGAARLSRDAGTLETALTALGKESEGSDLAARLRALIPNAEGLPQLDHLLSRLGFGREKALADALHAGARLNALPDDLKALVQEAKELLQRLPAGPMREAAMNAADNMVKTLTGEQLLARSFLVGPRGAAESLQLQIPVATANGYREAVITITRDPGSPLKRIDPENATIAFLLETENLGDVGLTAEVRGRALNASLSTGTERIRSLLISAFDELKECIAASGYELAGITAGVRKERVATAAPPAAQTHDGRLDTRA